MKISIDMAYKSVNHDGEELCGDRVQLVDSEDSRILILADGMGSGVRANILATLTSRMIATMMAHQMSVDEMVSTIAKTLPISSVNKAAYSTFSVIQVFRDGEIYVVEYDNPECILIRNGKVKALPFTYREIEGKRIRECRFPCMLGDSLAIMSDGCLYCGTGDIMNYRWDWNALSQCAEEAARKTKSASQMARHMNNVCMDLYGNVPTDDTTVAVCRIVEEKAVNILTGPPSQKELDPTMVRDFMNMDGIKVVSGGSTSQMVARELNRELRTSVGELDPEIPPISRIDGIDLVTEGVVTLNKVIELLEDYAGDDVSDDFFLELLKENGATRMVCYLIDDCTTVNLLVGKAKNEDYGQKTLPFEISARQNLVLRFEKVLKELHKEVMLHYY